MTKRVAIFISGGGSNMRTLVESMQGDHPARPCVIFSNNPDAAGIGWATSKGLATEVVDHRSFGKDKAAFEGSVDKALAPYNADLFCLAGFMRVLSPAFVDARANQMLNIHPSLLPKYPGLSTHARALDAGDTTAGCSVHIVTPVLDDGPILGQAVVPIETGDTVDSLAARVLTKEHQLYPKVLRRFAGGNRTRFDL
ncbi:MAG: phosphoribosylglycinamide formyltransferase [Paracoccaceae bacterium]